MKAIATGLLLGIGLYAISPGLIHVVSFMLFGEAAVLYIAVVLHHSIKFPSRAGGKRVKF